jgi:hypothetical protein
MTFKANKNGTWVGGDDQSQGTVVYGKSGDNWLYAKSVWANKDGSWVRSWTDCRRHDTGGRDWLPTTLSAVYSRSCGNRTYQIPTRYTKDGCPSYDVAGSTVSSPDCNSSCFTASTVNCDGCGGPSTLYTANSGSGCTTYTSGSCGNWNNVTENYGYNTPFSFAGTDFYTEYVPALGGYRAYVYDNFNGSYDGGTFCGGSTAYHLLYTCSANGNPRVTFVGCY